MSFYIWFLRRSIANKRTFKVSGESHSREWKGDKSSSTLLLRSLSSTAEQSQPEAQAIFFMPRGEGMRRCGYHHGCMGRGCHPHGVNACTSGVLIKKTIFGEMLTRKSLPKGPTYTYYTSSPLGHSRVSERERGWDKKATTNNFSLPPSPLPSTTDPSGLFPPPISLSGEPFLLRPPLPLSFDNSPHTHKSTLSSSDAIC